MHDMKIPYYSFAFQNQLMNDELIAQFQNVLISATYIRGNFCDQFEKDYAEHTKSKYAIGCGNGFDALKIALKSLGIGKGDEVIVPANTYIATWMAVSAVVADIIPVEPDSMTGNITPDEILNQITSKTKAIIPVHLYGRICQMDAIMKLASENNLFVIEDNAQAHFAKLNNKYAGTFGHVNATSFYPGKNLGAYGDAGAITTDHKNFADFSRKYSNYGSGEKYYNDIIGENSRLDELQAALLVTRIKFASKFNEIRVQNAVMYHQLIKNNEKIILPELLTNGEHVYHIFRIRCRKRDELQKFLYEKGIQTLIHYPVPPFLQNCYKNEFEADMFPKTSLQASESLSLPIYPGLTNNQIEFIADAINQFTETKL